MYPIRPNCVKLTVLIGRILVGSDPFNTIIRQERPLKREVPVIDRNFNLESDILRPISSKRSTCGNVLAKLVCGRLLLSLVCPCESVSID